MMKNRSSPPNHVLSFVVLLCLCAMPQAGAQTYDPALYAGLEWREIGPFRGGRSCAVSGVPKRPDEFYMGATGGGLWKTTNAGEDWENVSDGFFGTSSIGGIGVSASNPDVVYVGTGETELRGNISHGDGVYKTTDGGKTWTHVGLRETRFISRVRVHPTDPQIVYVAALGHVYGPNEERGIFKTTDGGGTWRKVLYVSDRAGAVDLSMDANDPDVIYASTWEAWRTPYSLNSGGPGSKIFKTTDGGQNWTEITRNPGLPKGTLGKIGIAVSPVVSNRVYAIVEAADGGIFRSDDAGTTWELVNDDRSRRQRAFYYTRIYADTKDADTIYVLNVTFYKSTDGGETFRSVRVPHSDNHDLWIDPEDSQRMINGNDGGGNVTTDGGRSWTAQDFATAQMYHVTTDNAFPYNILGAQQDNSTVRMPSRTTGTGITRSDWTSTAGGESGYIAAKPDEPDIVFGGSYGGYLQMRNHRTGQRRNVNAWPDNPMGHGAIDPIHRIQWTFPIVYSPHDPDLLYTCSQYLMKTTNGGQTWTKISPDLTRNDPSTLGPSGGPITKDNTGVEYYATIFTMAESPISKGVIWTGSDDGLLYITRNAGGNWTEITPPDMPEWGLCSMVEASPHDAGTAYLAVDNHENDDYTPYVYRTRDYGRTWTKIVSGIPKTTFVRVVREDPVRKGLLYAGTEMGVFVSFDDGGTWQSLQLNLPLAPIHDLVVKEDDIIVATHGRSFWVLDDVTPLHQLSDVPANADAYLFKPKDTFRVRWGGNPATDSSVGKNPLSGVILSYYLASDAGEVTFEISDSDGHTVASLEGSPSDVGWHRVAISTTSMRYPGFRRVPGMIMWAAGPRPISAPPGVYTVKMTAGDVTQTRTVRLKGDPRSGATDEDLIAQFELAMRVSERVNDANDAVLKIRDIREKIGAAIEKENGLSSGGEALKEKLSAVEGEIYQVKNRSGQDPLNYPIKLNNRIASLLGVVLSGNYRPTDQCYEVFDMLSDLLQVQLDALKSALDTDLAAFNRRLRDLGLDPIVPSDAGDGGISFGQSS